MKSMLEKPDYLDLDKDGNKTEPMKEATKKREPKSYGGRTPMYSGSKKRMPYEEGGSLLADDMLMEEPVMTEAMPDMDSDSDMEENYTKFIMDEALSEEEENMLVSKLEQDEELQMLFDKVIDVAQEFAGNGPVEGPGTGVSDDIPARLSDGEFVFTAKAVEEIGEDVLMSMMKEAEAAVEDRQELNMGGQPVAEEQIEVDQFGKPISSDVADNEIRKGMLSANPRLR
jgi:hypothetical protein